MFDFITTHSSIILFLLMCAAGIALVLVLIRFADRVVSDMVATDYPETKSKKSADILPFPLVLVLAISGSMMLPAPDAQAEAGSRAVRFPSFEETADYIVIINGSGGGDIAAHMTTAIGLMGSASHVVLNGPCASACVVILEMVRSKICFTDKATLGFHKSVMFDENNRPIFLDMHPYFRAGIREWVKARGGWPTPKYNGTQLIDANLLWMQPADMRQFWTHCGDVQ